MFRWIRRKLREIDYHSANRPSTIWTRATDAALVMTLLLAPLATWICDRIVSDATVVGRLSGIVGRDTDGSLRAFIDEHSGPSEAYWEHASQWGEWQINRIELQHGFPFPTATQHGRPELLLNNYTKPGGLKELPAGETRLPRAAVTAALRDAGFDDVARRLSGSDGPRKTHRVSWVIGSAVWWIILAGAGVLAVQLARVGFGIVWIRQTNRRFARRRAGHCAHCGYNLHGLEFNERCPECGHLVE